MNKLSIMSEVKKSLKILTVNKPFTHFNIALSHTEVTHLNNIKISQQKVYDNYGKLNYLKNELNEFIQSLNQDNTYVAKPLSILITKLVNEVILGFEKETAWVTLRASLASDVWDIPRWHMDGYYYPPYIGEQHKVVITLKGPASLFYPLPDDLREKFYSLQFDPKNREAIANMLDLSKSISAVPRNGTVYIVGPNYAAVHSEPPIHEERLFMSIVPGSKSQIQELYKNQKAYENLPE